MKVCRGRRVESPRLRCKGKTCGFDEIMRADQILEGRFLVRAEGFRDGWGRFRPLFRERFGVEGPEDLGGLESGAD